MNRINVLQIAGSFGIGGTEKVMQTFAEHLDRNFFNVYACGITGGVRKDLLEAHGIETCIVNHNQDELVRFLKDKEIHVFLAVSEQPSFARV